MQIQTIDYNIMSKVQSFALAGEKQITYLPIPTLKIMSQGDSKQTIVLIWPYHHSNYWARPMSYNGLVYAGQDRTCTITQLI
jgi:hypothetical protein